MEAHYKLAIMYRDGNGVEEDEEKLMHHFEEAAIGGHPSARHDLAVNEFTNGKRERAAKHWIIAANQGQDLSIQLLKVTFKLEGIEGGRRSVCKEDFAAALRGHQAAVKATKSPEREEAAVFYDGREY
jgi:TPR repeat protein